MLDRPQPTEEQLHIINQVRETNDNLVINALAGTGKTTTLQLVQDASPSQPVLYLAFNKRIAEEAEKKFSSTTTVRTLNSLGHRIWAKANAKNLKLNPKKTQDLLREIIKEFPKPTQSVIWDCFWEVVEGVAMAKALGYVPDRKFPNAKRLTTREAFHLKLDTQPDDLTGDIVDAVLTQSIKASYEGLIDFNDQIYMPTLFGGTFPRFPLVLGDEWQDFNPVNHAMLEKLVTDRLIAVGDPFQSIYAFRGAKQRGMEEGTERFKATTCNLSVSFRCPSEIVKAARWRVPHYQWLREGGKVEQLRELAVGNISDNSAIISRNNAPLFRTALQMLSCGRSVSVAGSDVGPKLSGILRKLGPENMPRSSVLSAIADWESEKRDKGSATASDMAECMRTFAQHGETLGQAMAYVEHLFAQKGSIRLITGHKAKGLEWDVVYHLDPHLIHDFNGDEQEKNLRYVIQTRSKDQYYEIDSGRIQW